METWKVRGVGWWVAQKPRFVRANSDWVIKDYRNAISNHLAQCQHIVMMPQGATDSTALNHVIHCYRGRISSRTQHDSLSSSPVVSVSLVPRGSDYPNCYALLYFDLGYFKITSWSDRGTELASDHGIRLPATPPDITWVLSCWQTLCSTCTFHNWNITIIK